MLATAALVLVTAAPVPQHFEPVRDFSTTNKVGDYGWYGDRFFRLERTLEEGEAPPHLPAACTSVMLDLETMTSRPVRFPLGAWATLHPELFYGNSPTRLNPRNGRTLGSVGCRQLVTWDGRGDTGGYLVTNTDGKLDATARSRLFYVSWSPLEPARNFHVALGESAEGSNVRSIGQHGARWYFEYGGAREPGGRPGVALAAVDLETRALIEIATLEGARGGTWWPSPDFSAFLYIEYSELSAKLTPPARLYGVSPSGEQFQLPAPVSTYGVAWLPDLGAVYLGSNELGTLQRLDLGRRTLTQVARGHQGVQWLQLTPNGKTLLVMTRGARVARYALEPFKALPALPIDALLPGRQRYSWDWSTFSPDRRQLMLSKNSNQGQVSFVDSEAPGVSLFKVTD